MRSSAKLKEKFIQAVAIDTLAAYYQNYSNNDKIFAAAEVRTKERKRADGLIVWKSTKRKTNVASIEAKSANTLRNLLVKPHRKKILRSSQQLSFALMLMVTILVFGLGYRLVLEPLMIVMVLVISIVLTILIEKLLYKIQLKQHQKIDVIEQIRQYPANERWIAIGFDSYTKSEQLATLLKKCEDNGFGLLIVRDEKVTKMELLPRFENYPTGSDFLRYYQKEKSIRQAITGSPTFGFSRKSPSQRAYQDQQRTYLFFYLVFLMFCSYWYIRPTTKPSPLPPVDNFPITVKPSVPIENSPSSPDSTVFLPPEKTAPTKPLPKITCSKNIKGIKYIVKVALCTTEAEAKNKAQEINALNPRLKANYCWLPCYKTPIKSDLFCVYTYPPRSHRAATEKNLNRLKYIVKQTGLVLDEMEVWRVEERSR